MYALRPAVPADYDAIAAVIDDWWGRPIQGALPRLFLDHFHRTSLIAEGASGEPAGFLIGILSPSLPDEAYIHFVGVAPGARQGGLGRLLYERFFELARADGRRVVKAITAPVNAASLAFHRRMGFETSEPIPGYNGPGTSLVTFSRPL
ncbi:GNAT family N-acetyltransferase [Nonomuraea gerenzanensis]|uniref:Acetyltransferase, GNAT family n=1 Tax=Nonomuraea gerenzanensis TaxID=93944 RepID=A0A1M4EK57_9ACTN|nr:GNAT family N-acetyltransferase [Nonomuraea gerenzanensis]UBU10832.1 GNAT family N-acetyltransferase [Nonomuraea gerenzanensis]SBO99265.1 acetyltransferase, GNAT family [Nonomuraea gerenzanensis]